jgi:hypothetical protein
MPVLDTVVPKPQYAERVKGTNKVEIKNGTRPAEIIEIWIYHCDKEGRYTKEQTNAQGEPLAQKIQIKVRFDARPDIVLAKSMYLSLGPKSQFGKLLQSLTGLEPGSPAMRAFNTDDLKGMKVLVTTDYQDPYTNVTAIAPPITDDDDFGAAPAHSPVMPESAPINPEAVSAKLKELLRSNLLLKGEKDVAICAVTGSPAASSIKTPALAIMVIAKLEQAIADAIGDVPF